MMKRLMSLLLALLLMLSVSAYAESGVGEKISNALYRIVLRTEDGEMTLGSAVLFLEKNILLTAESCCVAGDLYAVGKDGEHQILAWEKASNSGVALMEMLTASSAEPLTFAQHDTETLPLIFGVTGSGEIGSVPLTQALKTVYRGQDAVVFVGGEGMYPGSVAIDVEGGIMGLVIAQQAEGQGMYIALDPDGLYSAMMDSTGVDQFLPATLSWEEGMLHVHWEDEERTGGTYAISLTGDDNVYYTVYGEEATDRSSKMIVPSGHTYYVQVQWVEDGQEAIEPVWGAMTDFTVPQTLFTDYSFQQKCALACKIAGQNTPQPVGDTLSAAMIAAEAENLYLQINCSYDILETLELPLAVELIAPDGQFYFITMGYIFDPAYERDDVIFLSVEDLFTECANFSGGALSAGKYTLRYDVNGQLGGECSFTVTEDAAPVQTGESATSGFVTGLAVTEDTGVVTVSWTDAEIPEGANVTVFWLYGGNLYYTYQPITAGKTQTEFFTVPGRGVSVWAVWSMEEEVQHLVPQQMSDLVAIEPAAETAFTLNGFTNQHLSVVPSTDAAAGDRTELLPVVPITREAIADPDTFLYFQTHDTYQVSETSGNYDHPLAIVLCTPDGMCFVEYGYYIFDVTLQSSDQWLRDMSDLFDSHASFAGASAWPAGEYRILYCIDGQIAGEYAFTLE